MKQCENCGKLIAETAMFCKECGKKVERNIVKYPLKANQTLPKCPIIICGGDLEVNKDTHEVKCDFSIMNNSNDYIIAIFLKLIMIDISGEIIKEKEAVNFMDIHLRVGTQVYNMETIQVDPLTREVEIEVDRVVFTGKRVWKGNGEKLKSYGKWWPVDTMGKYKDIFVEELVEAGYNIITYVPKEWEDMWMCTCGRCFHEEEKCTNCGMGKKWLFEHSDNNYLKRLAAQKAKKEQEEKERIALEKAKREQEEKERAEREREERLRIEKEEREEVERKKKEKRKVIIAVLSGIVAVILLTVFITAWAIPSFRLKDAKKYMENSEYEKARELLLENGDFKNSEELLAECDYNRAGMHLEKEQYEEAYSIYQELDTYKDSRLKMKECIYQQAVLYGKEKKYEDAIELLESIQTYENTKEKMLEIRYHYATDLYSKKKYKMAIEQFALCDTYKKSKENLKKSKYKYADQLVKSGEYASAVYIYKELGNYKKSKKQQKKCIYLIGKEKYNAGKFEEAYKNFNSISYKDSAEWAKKSRYEYAWGLYTRKDYNHAKKIFKKLNGYKNSNDMIKACDYAVAMGYYEEEEYEKARDIFANLGEYTDSYKMWESCEAELDPYWEWRTYLQKWYGIWYDDSGYYSFSITESTYGGEPYEITNIEMAYGGGGVQIEFTIEDEEYCNILYLDDENHLMAYWYNSATDSYTGGTDYYR